MTNQLSAKYTAMIDDGKADEARAELLREAYIASPDEAAQALFLRLFERPVEPEKGTDALLAKVANGNADERRKAARKLDSLARGDWRAKRGAWLTDPRVIDQLLAATKTADEENVRSNSSVRSVRLAEGTSLPTLEFWSGC